MIIGIDLDNTIVNCETVFRQEVQRLLGRPLDGVAREQMRKLIREMHGDALWTQIQAEVYGPLYPTCPPFEGALDMLAEIASLPHVTKLLVISHKTERDSAGKNYALRTFADVWLRRHLLPRGFLREGDTVFLETKQEKIEEIVAQRCDVFFDDLPEIIEALDHRIPYPLLFRPVAETHPKFRTSDWATLKQHVSHVRHRTHASA